MIVELTTMPPDRLEVDGVALFLHADDRPPPGAAGLLDWRLNGALSRLLKEGWYRAGPGESLLVAPGRRMRASRLLVVGLGARREAGAGRLRSAAAVALDKLAALGVGRLAVVVPGPGDPPLTEAARAVSLVQGLLDTVRGARPPDTRPHVLLLVPEAAQEDTAASLAGLKERVAVGYPFDLRPLSPSRPASLSR